MSKTATINGIQALPNIPEPGQSYLSLNLAIVDVGDAWQLAKELGFEPKLVQISHRFGVEVHALLWHGDTATAPADLSDRVDAIADRLNPDAIRSVRGRMVA